MANGHKETIMSYDKLSLASFKEALKANKYVNATGARRAVGKATTLSDADKDKARAAIDAHFGTAPAASTPKKAAAKKTAAPKKQAAAKKTAAAKPSAPKKRARATSAAAPQAQDIPGVALAQVNIVDLEDTSSIATQMRIAEKTIQNVGGALSVITQAKQQYPEADLANVVEEMGGTLAGAVSIFRHVVHSISAPPAVSTPAPAPAPRQGIVNTGAPSRAEGLFRESGPEGEATSAAQG